MGDDLDFVEAEEAALLACEAVPHEDEVSNRNSFGTNGSGDSFMLEANTSR